MWVPVLRLDRASAEDVAGTWGSLKEDTSWIEAISGTFLNILSASLY